MSKAITTNYQELEEPIISTCSECESCEMIIDPTRGEKICANCGLVFEEKIIDPKQDWRAYNSEEEGDRARSGSPANPMIADFGLRTHFSNINYDANGTRLSSEKRFEFTRLSRLDNRSRQGEIRNLRIALKELQRIKSQLELPEGVGQSASLIYRRALKHDLVRGRSIDGIIAASVYLACRTSNIPMTLKDIQPACINISPKELGRSVRILLRDLKLKPANNNFISLVHRLAEQLNLNMEARKLAVEIVIKAKNAGITVGKNPMSVSAAALYIAGVQTGQRRTQLDMAATAKTTPVTIRNRFKELTEVLNLEPIKIKRGPATDICKN
jgi:transcription initiation factor TFIIB